MSAIPHAQKAATAELNPVDLYNVRSMLSEEERLVQDTVAKYVDEQVLPIIGECFEQERFPRELIAGVADLGLLGSSIHGYG
ncbi:MAG TPA: acyl-CoA dehydrogenase family protein, partial [Povalibacter sp.]|nr:acyl-CoA dehydrogenase family protein [Povalibacter sp.]